jgi:hypothetical protein
MSGYTEEYINYLLELIDSIDDDRLHRAAEDLASTTPFSWQRRIDYPAITRADGSIVDFEF